MGGRPVVVILFSGWVGWEREGGRGGSVGDEKRGGGGGGGGGGVLGSEKANRYPLY